MLELYVKIDEPQGHQIYPGKNKRFIDDVYEKADDIRRSFEEINFEVGLAILDYVQALIAFKKFRDRKEFKTRMKQAVNKFSKEHQVNAID